MIISMSQRERAPGRSKCKAINISGPGFAKPKNIKINRINIKESEPLKITILKNYSRIIGTIMPVENVKSGNLSLG